MGEKREGKHSDRDTGKESNQGGRGKKKSGNLKYAEGEH